MQVGSRLGRFRITGRLGSGGMGEVYRARDDEFRRDVAIKVLHSELVKEPGSLDRLRREARMLAAVSHPNVATIFDFEAADSQCFLVLELVEGETLAERMRTGRMPVDVAMDIARQLTFGLEEAHRNDVIHRDLKPGNVMIAPDGLVKILDFRLARPRSLGRPGDHTVSLPASSLPSSGGLVGTVPYMSPEQVREKELGRRTDIWAFGSILFEMLAGKRAFGRETVADTLSAILEQEPDWSALPAEMGPEVIRVLHRCLAKDRRDRLRDIGDVRLVLDDATGQLPADEPTESARGGPIRFVFEDYAFESHSGMLRRGNEEISLPPRAAALLACFLRSPGEILGKDELLQEAWPAAFVSEDSLTHAISLIRQALGDDPREPRFIQTLPRRGYRFLAAVEVQAGPVPSTMEKKTPPPPRSAVMTPARWAMAIVGIALAIVAVWLLARSADSVDLADAFVIRRFSLEVGPAQNGFTESQRDELIEAVAVEIEKRKRITVRRPGGEAGDTDALLRIDVRAEASRIIVDAEVRDQRDDDLWGAQTWDLPEAEFAPDLLARSLLSRLRFLLDLVGFSTERARSPSDDAVRLVVQASDLLLGAAQQDLHQAREAFSLLSRALQLDPGLTVARAGRWAARAETIIWRPWSEADWKEADEDVARALRDDPGDPIAHIAAALLSFLRQDLDAAFASLARAEELEPTLFWTYLNRAELECRVGRAEQALATARTGLDIDPYFTPLHGRLVDIYLAMDDLESAETVTGKLATLDQGGVWSERARARILWRQGRTSDAAATLLRLRGRFPDAPWVHQELQTLYIETGNSEGAAEAEATLDELAPDRSAFRRTCRR